MVLFPPAMAGFAVVPGAMRMWTCWPSWKRVSGTCRSRVKHFALVCEGSDRRRLTNTQMVVAARSKMMRLALTADGGYV